MIQKRNSNLIGEKCNVNVVDDDNKNNNDSRQLNYRLLA
jgi:hypothetical protein